MPRCRPGVMGTGPTVAVAGVLAVLLALPPVAARDADTPDGAGPAVSAAALAVHRRLLTLDTQLDTTMHLARPRWSIVERHSPRTDPAQVDL